MPMVPLYHTGSSLKSFMNIYLDTVIQPHRNHTIWLTWALVIASRAVAHPLAPKPCMKAKAGGCLAVSLILTPLGPVPLALHESRAAVPNVARTSSMPVYLRIMLMEVNVYMSTGFDRPGFPAVRLATKAWAPWYREI